MTVQTETIQSLHIVPTYPTLTCFFLSYKRLLLFVVVSNNKLFNRLSHDVVTRDVDRDVSTAYCMLIFIRRWGRLLKRHHLYQCGSKSANRIRLP